MNLNRERFAMHVGVAGWLYVVLMMSLAEATSPRGSLLGAAVTFVLYGLLPALLLGYLLGTPRRRAARRGPPPASAVEPDGGGHASGRVVPAKGEEA